MFDFKAHWPALMLAIFSVIAGQVGRLGHKLERGETLTWKNLFIELSIFPAAGSLVGALGAEQGLAIWQILGLGIAAGWAGFGFFRLVSAGALKILRLLAKEIVEPDDKPGE